MDAKLRKARKLSGLAKFERTCRRTTMCEGRLRLAYFVPGTQEAGEYWMYWQRMNDILKNP